ncbi:unnamed protein product [Heterotrigona itama]|uniref:EF-hand domain-containing protein n=1 Tax=Heterotrigona itama TaxID=395501 RepID=A0A6V7HEU9_9HYME|nr:unnamed protein product [Heterotrigona itama]
MITRKIRETNDQSSWTPRGPQSRVKADFGSPLYPDDLEFVVPLPCDFANFSLRDPCGCCVKILHESLNPGSAPFNPVETLCSHQSETTHWDHPKMIELMSSLADLNEVRFSAYRTAMKLRTVQKRLCLDMLSLSTALEQFDSHGLRAQNDKLIDIPDMVTVLTSLYEVITADNPTQVSVPLCIDLAINWLLNVYDR